MKKSTMAPAVLGAVLGAVPAVQAQSSVTLFGVVDLAYAGGHTSAGRLVRIRESGLTTSRIGFRGTEDLGGGQSAGFWLEAGVEPSDGQGGATSSNNQASGTGPATPGRQGLTFNRRSFVSLAGPWGEIRVGREYTPSFWNLTVFDPFATTGVATSQLLNDSIAIVGPTAARASNSLTYSTPGCFVQVGCNGFYGQLAAFLGENPSNAPGGTSRDGNGIGMRVGYASGPFNVAFGHGIARYATTPTAGDTQQTNIGLSWKTAPALLMAAVSRDRRDSASPLEGQGYLVGALVPLPPGELRVSWARYRISSGTAPDMATAKLSLGYAYHLSKRTAVYATVARLRNSAGAAQSLNGAPGVPGGGSTDYDIGLRHSF